MEVRAASFPADLDAVRALFRLCVYDLGTNLAAQDFDEELAGLPGWYVPSIGGIWLATDGDEFTGCVGLLPFTNETCEMRRLFVREPYRNQGLGRKLAEQAIETGKQAGYRQICTQTVPSHPSGMKLLRSLGFVEVESYTFKPVQGAVFFAKELRVSA